ncbi:MAG: ANTAR domain-containing protein [Caldilineales bacterium]|nr:ANTAR domain-containing protein [Caldilineales bacterium]
MSQATPPHRTRIVISDDESLIRRDLREMLTNQGYLVVGEASDGLTAVEMARKLEPDLVIMDIRFEDEAFDGIDAATILTEEGIAPVLLLSAYSQRDLVERARVAGVVGYLVKPFTEVDLPPAIETALARFEEFVVVRDEAEDLRDALETRKAVDRAKGLLMDKRGMTEAEAFRRIQKLSMNYRKPMREVAEAIILAQQINAGD